MRGIEYLHSIFQKRGSTVLSWGFEESGLNPMDPKLNKWARISYKCIRRLWMTQVFHSGLWKIHSSVAIWVCCSHFWWSIAIGRTWEDRNKEANKLREKYTIYIYWSRCGQLAPVKIKIGYRRNMTDSPCIRDWKTYSLVPLRKRRSRKRKTTSTNLKWPWLSPLALLKDHCCMSSGLITVIAL